jgi:competence protein ComGC
MGTVDPMNTEDLLDYALGQLDGPARDSVEAEIASNPVRATQVDRLELAIHQLLDDGETIEPPSGLASRTVLFVADRTSKRAVLDFVPARVPFRWADVAVAAGILMAGLLTLLPAMHATRNKVNQMGCGFNLQQLGASLASYAIRHNSHYPDVCSKETTGSHVGHYAVALKDENLLRDIKSLHCPCRGPCPEIVSPRPEPQHIDYAYNVGYRFDPTADPEPARHGMPAAIPLLADQPPHTDGTILDGNSPNHGFRGQNVLFSDLHVEWFATRRVKLDKDLFLNDQNLPEPGIGLHDSALVPAVFQVDNR